MTLQTSHQPIGIFDSGIGGLTVMKEIVRCLPKQSIVYLGDTARVPYGEKSPEAVTRFSIENGIFLVDQNVKLLVIACNTASCFALEKLQRLFKIPVVGVIEPAVSEAVHVTKNKKFGILGTKGTVRSGSYQREIEKRIPGAKVVSVACPLFVPFIEEGWVDHPALDIIVKDYLLPLKQENVDTVLLGCTHYPMLANLIRKELGPTVTVLDSAGAAARLVAEMLEKENGAQSVQTGAEYQFFVSDDPEKFRMLGQKFLGKPIQKVGVL
jgi:glutamate racemase